MNDQEQQGQQSNDGGKIQKNFDKAMLSLQAMLGGDKSVFQKNKVPSNGFDDFIEELIAERQEEAKKAFKKEATEVFDDVIAFNVFEKQKKQELDAAINAKKKELTKKINTLTSKIEGIHNMVAEYKQTLTQTDSEETPEEGGENNQEQ